VPTTPRGRFHHCHARFTASSTLTDDITVAEPRVIATGWRTQAGATWYHAADGWPRPGAMTVASKQFTADNFGPFTGNAWWDPSADVLRIYAKRPDTDTSDFTAVIVGLRVLRQRV